MKNFKILLGIVFLTFIFATKSFADANWINDAKKLYLSGNAIIYGINIRTFSAEDKNGDGIIDECYGEKRGNFLSAINHLNKLSNSGINIVNLLPVFPVGKVKAIGTAGSLYAPTSFTSINPQLKDTQSSLSAEAQMTRFVEECHKRNIRVIVDIPSCASYEMYLNNPTIFAKDANQNPITLSDWTDVRVLDTNNSDVYKMYYNCIQMLISLGVDGVRINNPEIKTQEFWHKLISQVRKIEPQFLFIGETSSSPLNNDKIKILSDDKILDSGFDGLGKFDKFNEYTKAHELYNSINKIIDIEKNYKGEKKVVANFATHDQLSPILVNGEKLSNMIIWLQATLPINSYFIDGFDTGDTYLFSKANKKAMESFTDDEYYFVHRGQLDIFNFSRKPKGENIELRRDFILGNKFKYIISKLNTNGNFKVIQTANPSVFGYTRTYAKQTIIVLGNLDFQSENEIKIKMPSYDKNTSIIPIKFDSTPIINKKQFSVTLKPGETFVLLLQKVDTE